VTSDAFPSSLARLQAAATEDRDRVWAAFLAEHSTLILRACRSVTREHDLAMDAYVHAIAALRTDDYRRLRAYDADDSRRFSVWLVAVTRRLALDHVRQRFGRPRSEDPAHVHAHATRRRLEQLVASRVAPELPTAAVGAEEHLRRKELETALSVELARLAPADRLLLSLRFVDERSVAQIARALGFASVFHVYRRLRVLLSLLRDNLALHGVHDAEP
jgi:RNA polymerase sigma factor (sigma-70 family)